MANIDSFTPDTVAAIRTLYDEGVSTAKICERFAMGRKSFYALRKANGWPPRGAGAARLQRMTRDIMIVRIENVATLMIARIETELRNPAAKDVALNHRILTRLRQVLIELERLKEGNTLHAPTLH